MNKLSKNEIEMILLALASEARSLTTMMNELERRNLHMGNQNVEIQRRRAEVTALIAKMDKMLKELG